MGKFVGKMFTGTMSSKAASVLLEFSPAISNRTTIGPGRMASNESVGSGILGETHTRSRKSWLYK